MSDFDLVGLDRVLPSTPGSADWEDVLGRSRKHERRRRVLAFAAAALVAVIATASAFGVRALVLDKGFVGLPPEGVTPLAPENGELVLHWIAHSTTLDGPLLRGWVYEDGRIIWSREGSIPEAANESTSGLLEQRLTPEGVELLRSRFVASGLLERSLTLLVPHSIYVGGLEVRDGDRLVRLRWDHPENLMPSEIGKTPTATQEQLSALLRVDALLADPASVLPAGAWADRRIRAYVPTHFSACLMFRPPKDAASLLSQLPARAQSLLRSKTMREGLSPDAHCAKLTTGEARDLVDALAGLPVGGTHRVGLSYQLAEPVDGGNPPQIWIDPYLPHGEIGTLRGG